MVAFRKSVDGGGGAFGGAVGDGDMRTKKKNKEQVKGVDTNLLEWYNFRSRPLDPPKCWYDTSLMQSSTPTPPFQHNCFSL